MSQEQKHFLARHHAVRSTIDQSKEFDNGQRRKVWKLEPISSKSRTPLTLAMSYCPRNYFFLLKKIFTKNVFSPEKKRRPLNTNEKKARQFPLPKAHFIAFTSLIYSPPSADHRPVSRLARFVMLESETI